MRSFAIAAFIALTISASAYSAAQEADLAPMNSSSEDPSEVVNTLSLGDEDRLRYVFMWVDEMVSADGCAFVPRLTGRALNGEPIHEVGGERFVRSGVVYLVAVAHSAVLPEEYAAFTCRGGNLIEVELDVVEPPRGFEYYYQGQDLGNDFCRPPVVRSKVGEDLVVEVIINEFPPQRQLPVGYVGLVRGQEPMIRLRHYSMVECNEGGYLTISTPPVILDPEDLLLR